MRANSSVFKFLSSVSPRFSRATRLPFVCLSQAVVDLRESRSITLQIRALHSLNQIFSHKEPGYKIAFQEMLFSLDASLHMVRDEAWKTLSAYNPTELIHYAKEIKFSAAENPGLTRFLAEACGAKKQIVQLEPLKHGFKTKGIVSMSRLSFGACPQESAEKIVYLFLPTAGSAEKAFPNIDDTLKSLRDNLTMLPAGYAYKLFICTNNCQDSTEAKIIAFMINHPNVDITLYSIPASYGHFGKVAILNFLYSQAKADMAGREGIKKAYIHMSDDDIVLYPVKGQSAIAHNIQYLEAEGLSITSGNVVNTKIPLSPLHPIRSFWAYLSGVRKLPEYAVRLAQAYGCSMTMQFETYPCEGIPDGLENEDCWFSAHEGYSRVATNPQVLVEHAPEDTAVAFIGRWLRDLNHAHNLKFQFLFDPNLSFGDYQAFRQARLESFRQICLQFSQMSWLNPRRQANWLSWKIKQGTQLLWEEGLVPDKFKKGKGDHFFHYVPLSTLLAGFARQQIGRASQAIGLQRYDQHERYVVLARHAEEMVGYLCQAGWITPDEKSKLFSNYSKIKKAEEVFAKKGLLVPGAKPSAKDEAIILGNHKIAELYDLLVSAYEKRQRFETPAFARRVFKRAGILLGHQISVKRASNRGRVNPTYIVTDHSRGKSYFVKLIDFLGLDFNQMFPETTARFIAILNEEINAEAMGGSRIVRSLYPSLLQATEAYLSPKDFFDEESDFLERIIIQEDLSGQASTIEDLMLKEGAPQAALVEDYARVLADLHGKTFSLRKDLLQGFADLGSARALLNFPEIVRNREEANYSNWLRAAYWRLQLARKYLNHAFIGNSYPRFAQKLLERQGLAYADFYEATLGGSVEFVAQYGSKGHFDGSSKNVFKFNNGEVKMFDFEQLGFIDPALEVAVGMKSVLKNLLKSGKLALDQPADNEKAAALVKCFCASYFDQLVQRLPSGLPAAVIQDLKTRSLRFFALFVLDRLFYMVDLAKPGLANKQLETEKTEDLFFNLCLEMLNA